MEPTFDCKIIKENPGGYIVQIKCDCGHVHEHGIPKSQIDEVIGKPDHRVAHCSYPKKGHEKLGGYYLLLSKKSFNEWGTKKK